MPTTKQTAEAAAEISYKLQKLGFDDIEQQGPYDVSVDDSNANEYYVYAQKLNSIFYIRLIDEFEFGVVVYPFNIALAIGNQLSTEEIEDLLDVDINGDPEQNITEEAGRKIIEQTPIDSIWRAKFYLSAYANTPMVSYREETADNDFPLKYQCVRSVFPYDGEMTLRELDDRVETTLTAGIRGARYVRSSFIIEKKDGEHPSEYVLSPQF
jgi:hypothetical protein